jgi:DNA-binding transcriptional ArsR family regulator
MSSAQLNRAFAALSDPTRRAMVARLAAGEATVKELAAPFAISAPAISRHLRVLEQAGLVSQQRQGQFRKCRLNVAGLRSASEWLDFTRAFWSDSFDRLEQHLKTPQGKKEKSDGRSRQSRTRK